MTEARIGWGGECWLSTDGTMGNLIELLEVVSFGLPDDQVDEVEATHLKSPNKRKEYIAGLADGGDIEVTLNYVPGSPTDIAVRNAKDARNTRAIRFVIPDEAGMPEWKVETYGFVKGYSRGPISAGDKIEATITVRITGAQAESSVAGGVAPVNTVTPAITGTAKVGTALSVSNGTWTGTPAPTFTYRWFVGGIEVPGAIASSYTPVTGDIGKPVIAEVRANNSSGTVSRLTAPTANIVA